jgi:hypothetical protein
MNELAAGKKKMTNNEMPSSNISTRLNIYFVKPSQTAIAIKEDDVKDVNDHDISTEMKKQVPLEELNPPRIRLNND